MNAVWQAFAAGTLGALSPQIASADCALPSHESSIDAQSSRPITGVKAPPITTAKPVIKAGVRAPPPIVTPVPPVEHPPLPGRMVAPTPPVPRKLGGAPVAPAPAIPRQLGGGPVSVEPPPKTPQPKPPKPRPPEQHLDGEMGFVAPAAAPIHLHPHGPDEPCHPPGEQAPLVVRWS